MPSIFLSHTSYDKIFVEKLARDLTRIGVNAWFDKWCIKVGDSITWKIEEGIKENEFLGIVLSPEALNSEWVKSEIGAAWVKQMKTKKVVVLPILYRDCNIPYFLSDRKYADFRHDYDKGFSELAAIFGINDTDTISVENWRKFCKKKNSDWQKYRDIEFSNLVTTLVDRAIDYNWSSWVSGSKNPYSITLSAFIDLNKKQSISIRLDGKTNCYKASFKDTWNPRRILASDFDIYIGNSINECEEFLWRHMEDYRNKFGVPSDRSDVVDRRLDFNSKMILAENVIKQLSWYNGNKLNKGKNGINL